MTEPLCQQLQSFVVQDFKLRIIFYYKQYSTVANQKSKILIKTMFDQADYLFSLISDTHFSYSPLYPLPPNIPRFE